MLVELERADVPVSPAAEDPEGGVPTELVDEDVEPDSLGVVPPAAEDGEVVVVDDDEVPGAGAPADGGGVVMVVDELDEGA